MVLPGKKLDDRMTLQEYLSFEEASDRRHEFHAGEVLEMSGGTYTHSRVTTNLVMTLGGGLRGGPCQVLDANMSVATQFTQRYVYPDASILCDEPDFLPGDASERILVNPRVVFEVLSDSTEAYDRGGKFQHYQLIPSLQEYILIAQHEARIEGFLRMDDGGWSMMSWVGADAVARVRSVELDLPLLEVYRGVEFSQRAAGDGMGVGIPVE